MAVGLNLFVATVLAMELRSDSSIEDPVSLMLYHCPATRICDSSTLRKMCCLSCSCSSDCEVAGDCCVNNSNTTPPRRLYHTSNNEACIKTYISQSLVPAIELFKSKSFLLVDNCPSDYDGSERHLCLYPNETDANQRLPVYSKVTMLNYKNKYCAICNGRTEPLVPWSVYTNCAQLMYSVFYQPEIMAREFQRQTHCYILFQPPPSGKARRCFHEDDVVNTCPPGTTGTIYGQQITTLCDTFYSLVVGNNYIYQNVFCMECHEHTNITENRLSCGYLFEAQLNALSFLLADKILKLPELTSKKSLETRCPAGLTYVVAVVCIIMTFVLFSFRRYAKDFFQYFHFLRWVIVYNNDNVYGVP